MITLYTFEDQHGENMTFTTFDSSEALDTARRNQWRCIANEYEYLDCEVAWDFTLCEHEEPEL